ncbi:unnamed protein product, partial [marine sediment metagenome]
MPVSNPSDAGPLIALELLRHAWTLTPAGFKDGTPSGNCLRSEDLNDGMFDTSALFDPVDEYAII